MTRKLAPSFATVADLAARAGEPIDTPEDIALAKSLLAIVSAQIRMHGDAWPSPVLAPDICWAICVAAAARGYENPAQYSLERGDMQTLQRGDNAAAGEELTKQEIRAIKAASLNGSFWIVAVERPVIVSDKRANGGSDSASISLA